MYPLLLMSSVAVILDQHINKSLQTLNGLRGLHYFCLGVTEQPTKAPFFWWAVLPNILIIKEPTSCEVSHKFIGSAS